MKRVIPGLMLAACWLLILLSGYFYPFLLVTIALGLMGAHEYLKMVVKNEVSSTELLTLSPVLILPIISVGIFQKDGLSVSLYLSILLVIGFVLFRYSRLSNSFDVLSRLVFGCLYIGFLPAYLLLIWLCPEGARWLIILAAITAGSDSGAYYFGKNFGKHKLSRYVSPNKTVEGAVGGLICGLLTGLFFSWLLLKSVNWTGVIFIGVALIGVGIVGDLCESVIKRGTNTKDSGTILMGHGGVLDRVDSIILAAPLLYYYLMFTGLG